MCAGTVCIRINADSFTTIQYYSDSILHRFNITKIQYYNALIQSITTSVFKFL